MKKYYPSDVSKMTVKQLRTELGKENKIARKRMQLLQRDLGRTPDYIKVKPVRGMNKAELQTQLADINKFLRSYESKVSKVVPAERKRINTLNKRFGEKNAPLVTKANIVEFGDFMDWISEIHGELKIGSPPAVTLFNELQKNDIKLEDFQKVFGKYLSDRRYKKNRDKIMEDRMTDVIDALQNDGLKPGSAAYELRQKMQKNRLI